MSVAERVRWVIEQYAPGRDNAMAGELIAALAGSTAVYVRAVCSRLRADGYPVRSDHARSPRGYWWEVVDPAHQRRLPLEVERAARRGDLARVRRHARHIADEMAQAQADAIATAQPRQEVLL